jgi:hypothetical protein
MLRITIRRAACTALALQAFGAAAAHASNLTAKVAPPDPGTAQSPQPHTTTMTIDKMDPGAGGNANSAAVKLVESMPVDFAATLDRFAACPSSKVVHGDNKPSCPDSSVLGNVAATAYVPALLFSTTSDQGYIFKISDNAVRAWVHVSNPQPAGIVVDGALSRGSAPYGPVITWDLSSLASGAQAGAEIRINSVGFTWAEQTGTASATPVSPTTGTHTRQSRSCQARARRIKNKRKRRAALRRCAKSRAKKKARKGSARVAQASSSYSPFVSTGCSGGGWPFHAEATFADGSKETADAKVACASTTASPPPSSPPPASPPSPPTSPLCPPLCGVATTASPSSWSARPPPLWGGLSLS